MISTADSTKRVVITGFGVISPIGCNLDTFRSSLEQGKSGIGKLELIPEKSIPVENGAEVKAFSGDIENYGPLEKTLQRNIRKGQKVMCREIEMGVAACQHALHHSGLHEGIRNPERTGIVYGSDYILTRPEEYIDGMIACRDSEGHVNVEEWPEKGIPNVNPLWLLKYLPNMPASHVAIYNDLRGPSNSITIREASNNLSIAEAVAAIRRGVADAMVVGSTGCFIHPLRAIHASGQVTLAKDRANPAEMSRPFDRDRDGVVLGEGAGAMTIESLEHAQARGAKIYGEILGGAASAVGATTGRDYIRIAVGNVLRTLQERFPDFFRNAWHLHASGRGEIEKDRSEAGGVVDAFGDASAKIPVFAGKSYFGNLGAGGAAVELIASCMALEKGSLFSTLNYQTPDPECPLFVAPAGTPAGQGFVHMSYSPQGQASAVLVRRFEE